MSYLIQNKLIDQSKTSLPQLKIILFIVIVNWLKNINLKWVTDNSAVIHYCGRNKPWKENYKGFLDVFYKQYSEGIIIVTTTD